MTEKTTYRPDLVQRAVHLIRDPFDNVVSRYHLEHNHVVKMAKKEAEGGGSSTKYTDMLKDFTLDREGFRSFCFEENDRYATEEEDSKFIEDDLYELIKDVPCHADFLRYVRWHNFAFMVRTNLKLQGFVMHYEDYEKKFDQVLGDLLAFLGRKRIANPKKDFVAGKRYAEEYFTFEERGKIYELMKEMGYSETWNELRRYFDEKESG